MKKKLKIGILVGENIDKYSNYGFTMRIGWQIEGLKKLGHDVFLYALDKSNSSNLVKCYPQNIDLQERHKKKSNFT
ncbi:MAG: hypothetical protein ABIA91_00365 [Patescibacteria group bacterium]